MNWIRTSAVLVLVAITVLSLMPPSSGVRVNVNDKFGHALAYFVLTTNVGLLVRRKYYPLLFILVIGYSCLMEFFQGFVPGRTVSWLDVVANATGAVLGCLLLYCCAKHLLALLRFLRIVR